MRLPLVIAALMSFLAAPAAAALPEPVKAMIDAAIEGGDAKAVGIVIDLAKKTNPGEADAIDQLHAGFVAQQASLASSRRQSEIEAIRSAGLFQQWTGKGEIGAYRSTGNSDVLGLTGALSLDRKGIDWQHKLAIRADYQRSRGRTTREKLFASYEPQFQVRDNLFAYGLAQFERDRFQGFDSRYALSGGIGTKLIDTQTLNLSIKAGPALRITDAIEGPRDTRLAALAGFDFDWAITDRLKLTQNTNAVAEGGGAAVAIIDSRNTTINVITGLEAKVSERLSTRFSYAVDYDSNPLPGKLDTDTTSRFSLVYGF